MPSTVRALVLAVMAGVLASACDDAPPPKPASGAPGPAKPSATVEGLVPPNMVSAVSASKTSASIGVHFRLETPPVVGKPLGVEIAVIPHRPFNALNALFQTPNSVILATGDRFDAPGAVKPETVFSHKLVVQPTQEGVFLITAAVESESEEGTITRVYSIPVIVYGELPARKPAAPAAAPAPAG
jgi:hypothetical protein